MMQAVLLAGGFGTRIAEESDHRPKPMAEIGGKPLLWHIMKTYAHHGVTDFVVCCGYKGYVIKEYFANLRLHQSDVTVDTGTGALTFHAPDHVSAAEPWRVTLVDTGLDTMTGGRLKRVARYLDPGRPFCMTYGDGLADIDIGALVAFHRAEGRLATLTAVAPPGRYGALDLDGARVVRFTEKPPGDRARINGGYFVLESAVLDLIEGDATAFEAAPLETLAARGQLSAFPHDGFWQPMDTLRDKRQLEALWAAGAPWKVWP
jgi:glucose-1-phosphate cytidylyltransferase